MSVNDTLWGVEVLARGSKDALLKAVESFKMKSEALPEGYIEVYSEKSSLIPS